MSKHQRNTWMPTFRSLWARLAVVTMVSGSVAVAQTSEYSLTKLGKPAGATNAVGVRMNELGHVAGWSSYPVAPDVRGWIWTPQDGFTVLPTPPGAPTARFRAMDINGSGVVCGDGGGFAELAWRFESNAYTTLGAVDGMTIAYLGGINGAGDIAGTGTDQSITTSDVAFLGINGGAQFNLTPGSGGRATDINNLGQVAGYTHGAPTFEAFRWDAQGGRQLLGSLGLGHSFANAISESGHVVGEALALTGDVSMPFIYTDGLGMQQIPAPVTLDSKATGVNSQGHVVGTTVPLTPNADIPWLWTGGGSITDLNTLFDPAAESFNALAAHDINDNGQILAFGFDNNAAEFRTVLLTPAQGPVIPTVSQWGMVAMTLMLLSVGTILPRLLRTRHGRAWRNR